MLLIQDIVEIIKQKRSLKRLNSRKMLELAIAHT